MDHKNIPLAEGIKGIKDPVLVLAIDSLGDYNIPHGHKGYIERKDVDRFGKLVQVLEEPKADQVEKKGKK